MGVREDSGICGGTDEGGGGVFGSSDLTTTGVEVARGDMAGETETKVAVEEVREGAGEVEFEGAGEVELALKRPSFRERGSISWR